jgi:PKD repeat protein
VLKINTKFILFFGVILTNCGLLNNKDESVDSPIAVFEAEPVQGYVPLTVAFTNKSDPGTGSNVEYLWDFGDGGTATTENPDHTFTDVGFFPVTLTTTTTHGSDISDPQVIRVDTTVISPVLLLSSSSSSITIGESTSISLKITDLGISIFGVEMQISYNVNVVEVDTLSFVQGSYFGTNAISLFQIMDDKIHLSISAIHGDAMVNGTGQLASFEVTGLSSGTSTFTIVPEELHFIDDNGNEMDITDYLEVRDLTVTVP